MKQLSDTIKEIVVPLVFSEEQPEFCIYEGADSSIPTCLASEVWINYDPDQLQAVFEILLDCQRQLSPTALLSVEADGIFTVSEVTPNDEQFIALVVSMFTLRSDGLLSCRFERDYNDYVEVSFKMQELLV